MSNVVTPAISLRARLADVAERALWTLVQAASATGIVAGYQAINRLPDIPEPYIPVVVIVLTAVLSVIKGTLAQKFGNGTAATLPTDLEPVPTDLLVEVGEIGAQPQEDFRP